MSEGDRRKDQATVPTSSVTGNALFEKAVAAVGLDDNTTRWMFVSCMKTLAVAPQTLTPDDLGNLLPEIDRRLRKLTRDDAADAAMKRLYRLLFEQADKA